MFKTFLIKYKIKICKRFENKSRCFLKSNIDLKMLYRLKRNDYNFLKINSRAFRNYLKQNIFFN